MHPKTMLRQLLAVTTCAWGLVIGSTDIALATDIPQSGTALDHMERFKNMSPEERTAKRQQMRERWSKLSPEEKQQRRNKMRERIEKMTPEQKEHFLQERRERQQARRQNGGDNTPGVRDTSKP